MRESRKEGKGKREKDKENEDEKRRRSRRRRDWQGQKFLFKCFKDANNCFKDVIVLKSTSSCQNSQSKADINI